MEAASGVLSSVRIVLNVVTSQRRPELEIYCDLRNLQVKRAIGGGVSGEGPTDHWFQEIFLQFALVNVGGVRAENVRIRAGGTYLFKSNLVDVAKLSLLNSTIPQVAPAQIIHLFALDNHDLYTADENGKLAKLRPDTLDLTIHYDGPKRGINRLLRRISRLFHDHQYETLFHFNPVNFSRGDLPPAEYVG